MPTESGIQITVSVGFGQGADASRSEKDELQQLLGLGSPPSDLESRRASPDCTSGNSIHGLATVRGLGERESVSHCHGFSRIRCKVDCRWVVSHCAVRRIGPHCGRQRRTGEAIVRAASAGVGVRGYRALRAKVFARPDMLDAPKVKDFPDASKVFASGTNLEWRTQDLYGLLFQYLGNASDETAAAAFRRIAGRPTAQSRAIMPLVQHAGKTY